MQPLGVSCAHQHLSTAVLIYASTRASLRLPWLVQSGTGHCMQMWSPWCAIETTCKHCKSLGACASQIVALLIFVRNKQNEGRKGKFSMLNGSEGPSANCLASLTSEAVNPRNPRWPDRFFDHLRAERGTFVIQYICKSMIHLSYMTAEELSQYPQLF